MRTRHIAICPDCEAVRNLEAMPAAGDQWPTCKDCCVSMNVYERQRQEASHEHR